MEADTFKWLMEQSGIGIIAGLLFYAYRKDVRSYTDLWRETSLMLASDRKEGTERIVNALHDTQVAYSALVREGTAAHVANTETNREMISLLQALHRRMDVQDVPPASSRAAIQSSTKVV